MERSVKESGWVKPTIYLLCGWSVTRFEGCVIQDGVVTGVVLFTP